MSPVSFILNAYNEPIEPAIVPVKFLAKKVERIQENTLLDNIEFNPSQRFDLLIKSSNDNMISLQIQYKFREKEKKRKRLDVL